MKQQHYLFALILSCFVFGCKSSLLTSLVSEQEWSENYALLDGATCTSPEMIDGDLETVGRAGSRIFVTLPERQTIHRVVIKGTNIEDVILYANIGGSGDWRKIRQVKNNTQSTIDLRASFATDQIRLVVGGTFDDQRIAGTYSAEYDAIINRQVKRGTPVAQEIELYGFATKEKNEEDIEEMSIPILPAETEDIEEEAPEF